MEVPCNGKVPLIICIDVDRIPPPPEMNVSSVLRCGRWLMMWRRDDRMEIGGMVVIGGPELGCQIGEWIRAGKGTVRFEERHVPLAEQSVAMGWYLWSERSKHS